jgi:quercetin dioxygenase-like cupin family protein
MIICSLYLSFYPPWDKKTVALPPGILRQFSKRRKRMIHKKADGNYIAPLDGVEQKTLVHGENTLMTKFRLKRNAAIPPHRHPHEQTGYLVSGRLRMHIDGKSHELEPGDAWCIPGDVEHGADALEDTLAVEVFSPVRQDYIPANGGLKSGK